ncbi:MAG: glycosyltransferase family 4 protein [Termitinemataceae bacterium]|nr:MAG: glycosyltransferase family 4 protein [Termitinemataceae bacterium]
MKIVMFTDSYWPRVNGVSVSVESFAYTLIKRGHEVLIICPFYPETATPERFSLTAPKHDCAIPESSIIRVPSIPLYISKEDRLSKKHKMFWVKRKIDKFNPDIIHIQSEFVTAGFGYYCARLQKIPTVYTLHTLWENYMKNYLPYIPMFVLRIIVRIVRSRTFRRTYRVIVPSQMIYDLACRYKLKKEPYLLPTGIDENIFQNTKEDIDTFKTLMELKYPIIKGKKILLFAGRIGREKNIDLLMKIAPSIIQKHPEVIFLIVGNGPDMYWYKEECISLAIQDHIIFSGYMERKDLSLAYAVSYIFVFPSMSETQGLVTIEAMLSGLPVVAIGEGGTKTMMNGDNGGFMVKNDEDEFANRIVQLLEDTDLYEKKSAEAKEYAKKWTIDIMTERLEKIYKEIISDYKREN